MVGEVYEDGPGLPTRREPDAGSRPGEHRAGPAGLQQDGERRKDGRGRDRLQEDRFRPCSSGGSRRLKLRECGEEQDGKPGWTHHTHRGQQGRQVPQGERGEGQCAGLEVAQGQASRPEHADGGDDGGARSRGEWRSHQSPLGRDPPRARLQDTCAGRGGNQDDTRDRLQEPLRPVAEARHDPERSAAFDRHRGTAERPRPEQRGQQVDQHTPDARGLLDEE